MSRARRTRIHTLHKLSSMRGMRAMSFGYLLCVCVCERTLNNSERTPATRDSSAMLRPMTGRWHPMAFPVAHARMPEHSIHKV